MSTDTIAPSASASASTAGPGGGPAAPVSVADMKRVITKFIMESGNPDLVTYGSHFLKDFEVNCWSIQDMMRQGRMFNGRVLDIGAGFGWHSLIIAVMGNNRVVANDIRDTMTRMIDERTAAVRDALPPGVNADLTTHTGDICEDPFPAESFDAVYCFEAIEHIHDLPKLFRVVHKILKPGGRCVFANDNNALNKRRFDDLKAMWARRDGSQEYIDQLKKERPIENADIEPYAVMRARIVREANPNLAPAAVEAIVKATAGLTRAEIEAIARDYTEGKALPTPPSLSWCRNPETKEYCERLLDPYELSDMLAAASFKTQVRHAFRRFPLVLLNPVPVRPLNNALFNVKSAFRLVGEKI